MPEAGELQSWPLSASLTRRVVHYLNGFRLFISLALGLAYLSGYLVHGETINSATFAGAVFVSWFLFSLWFTLATRVPEANPYELAQQSLLTDLILIALLLLSFPGLGVLLVFVGAAAGILLPLRFALLMAALGSIAIIGEPMISGYTMGNGAGRLLQSGLWGLTLFVITALTHALARWAHDFRLIAERQMVTLTRLEQINELIIRRLPGGVIALTQAGEIRVMNEAAWFLAGNPAASVHSLQDMAPELHEALLAWRADPRAEPQPLMLQTSQVQVLPRFVALPAGLDISEIVFLEDSEVVAQRAHEMSAVTLAKLSTSIAHEIRNPLSAVSHAAQMLGEDPQIGGEQARLVEIINKQSRRMNRIVENILQISRREKSQPEIFELLPWLEDLEQEFRSTHTGPQYRLAVEREQHSGLLVLFDRSQLHQVLWKLMENAQQHLPPELEQPELLLRLSREPDAGYCMISVEDNGAGIPAERLSSIFEPFYTTRKEGSGLGLYIARQICEANRAELTVDSVPGVRTRFNVRIAIAPGSLENPGGTESPSTHPAP